MLSLEQKSNLTCGLKMFSTTILIVSSICWLHVTSQPTRSNDYNDQCGAQSTEMRTLLLELRSMKKEIKELHNLKDQINILNKYAMLSDCSEIQKINKKNYDGIYTVTSSNGSLIQVYCDMTTDGGGWLVFQRRQDGSENFYRNWEDYRQGFGKLDGEFWLGNDALAFITNQRSYELRVDLEDYDGVKEYAEYDHFSLDQRDHYKLSLGSYTGTAGDSLKERHNGHRFTTYDQDHDADGGNCAVQRKGAWWYNDCTDSNLNGQYGRGTGWEHVVWGGFRSTTSLKFTEMKIRPTSKN